MTDQDIKSLQGEELTAFKDNCNHIGAFVGFGLEAVPTSTGGWVAVASQNCAICGKIFVRTVWVQEPPTNIPKKGNEKKDKILLS